MINVLAIDPGEKVGWAWGEILDERFLQVRSHGIQHLKPFALELATPEAPLFIERFDVVIYERWRLQARYAQQLTGNDMQTSQLIGMIRLLAWQHSVKLVAQDPKDYKQGWVVAPPTVRAILDTLPKAHDESHDGPALGHLAHYWFKNYFDPTKEAL
jgi:hypothetical protein